MAPSSSTKKSPCSEDKQVTERHAAGETKPSASQKRAQGLSLIKGP